MRDNGHEQGDTLLFYDVDCGFCAWSVARVLTLDRRRRLRPVPLQDALAEQLLGHIPPAERMASWHLAEPDGTIHSGGDVFAAILRRLPRGQAPAAAASAARRPLGRAYRWGAARRSVWGRLLTPAARDRARHRIERRKRVLEPARRTVGSSPGEP